MSVRIVLGAILVFACTLAGAAFAQSGCDRAICADPHHPHYFGDGHNALGDFAYCGAIGGLIPSNPLTMLPTRCPAGTVQVAHEGICRDQICFRGRCEDRLICADARWPLYAAREGRDVGGPYAQCLSNPAPISGAQTVSRAHCPSRFEFVAGTGICRLCPLTAAPSIRGPPVQRAPPNTIGRPTVRGPSATPDH